jgi:hypothetical protein
MIHSDYIVFVDESGDHSLISIDTDYPVFVLCFCIFHKDHYAKHVVPMVKELKLETFGHDLVILHESDIRRKRGYFSQLNKEKREDFLNSLTSLIESFEFTLISVVIDKNKHQEKYNRPEHPYHLALQFGLERLYSFLNIKDEINKQVHIICEARGKKEDNDLELAFRRVCDGANRTRKTYNFTIFFADKKVNSEGLQIADLAARPIGLSVLKPNQPNRAYEILEDKFFTGYHGVINGNGRKIFP